MKSITSSEMKMLPRALTIILFVVNLTESARILIVVPSPSLSHHLVFRPFIQELLSRGHQVVVITTDPAYIKEQTPPNLTEVDLHNISYSTWRKQFTDTDNDVKETVYQQVTMTYDVLKIVFADQIKSEEFQNVMRNRNFDLVIIEAYFRPLLFLTHLYKVPVIQMSSFGSIGNYKVSGSPRHTLLYPELPRHRYFNLTIWETMTELYMEFKLSTFIDNHEKIENDLLKSIIDPKLPDLSELSGNVDMVYLNFHPMWDSNRPVTPGFKYLGSLHLQKEQDLPKELKSYLDAAKNGVIYVSFGTNVNPSQLPAEKLQVFIKVFSELPYDVLWKWDKNEMPEQPKNIRISEWLPQADLLKHPKLKLFITQAGLQSTDEAITAGVPVIGIPILFDQWWNAEKYVHHKIGMKIELKTLTEDQLKSAIHTVIEDESYRRNVVRLRSLMYDQPQQSLERAVWWTEHVLRHAGAHHLRAPAANMDLSDYLELELISIVTLSSFVILYLMYKTLCVII